VKSALFLSVGWIGTLGLNLGHANAYWSGCESLKPLVTEMGLEPVFFQGEVREFKRSGGRPLTEEQAKKIYYSANDRRAIELESSCPAYKNLRSFDCAKRISHLRELRPRAITTPALALAERFSKVPAKVLMVGESHYHESGIAYLSEILKETEKAEPKLDCLFVEVHSQHQTAFDLYAAEKITLEEMIRMIRKEGGESRSTDPAGGVDELLTKTARDLGVKVIPVDRPYSNNPGESRDVHMAELMRTSFDRKTCTRAMFRVGKEHLKWKDGAASLFCLTPSDCLKVDMMLPDDSALAQEECPRLGHTKPPLFSTLALYPVKREPVMVLERFFLEPFSPARSPAVNEFEWLLVVPESR
jgi:hypothetical protein